jgi:hypothetical protein
VILAAVFRAVLAVYPLRAIVVILAAVFRAILRGVPIAGSLGVVLALRALAVRVHAKRKIDMDASGVKLRCVASLAPLPVGRVASAVALDGAWRFCWGVASGRVFEVLAAVGRAVFEVQL